MGKITTIMSVCGDRRYYAYADYSIPSFCLSNPGARLIVFTETPDELAAKYYPIFDNVLFLNFMDVMERLPHQCKHIGFHTMPTMRDFRNHDRTHHHEFVSLLLPMGQMVADTEYILKIDCDAYFRGPLIEESERFIGIQPADLYLVQRVDPVMVLFGGNLPGVGYTLWRRASKFMDAYIGEFERDEQTTIVQAVSKIIPTVQIQRPGYHVVYPFCKAEKCGVPFTKDVADKYYPAYFHCGGKRVEEQLKTLEAWYG